MTRRPAILATLSTWLLPFAVATAGFGVHFALHVPPGPLPPPSPAKVEEDRKAADRKKKEEERKKKEEDRKAGRKTPKVERSTVKELPYESFTQPRKPYLLSQLWAYYEPIDFKKEPTFDAWQTAHKPLLAQIVQATRTTGFAEPPTITVGTSECHTIRCRFSLTGSDAAQIEQLTEHLQNLQIGGGPLWHDFEATAPAVDKKDAAKRLKSQVTVSFMRDMPPLAEISLPGKGALSTPRPTSTPRPAPSPTAPGAAPTTSGATGPTTTPPSKSGPSPSTTTPGFTTPADAPLRERKP
jgi:hypothetical protein